MNQVTHRCRVCRAPRHVERVEVTTLGDLVRGVRTYLWGEWRACWACGDRNAPELVVDEADALTRPLQ